MGLYRGAGGVEWEIDPPKDGTQARERFDAQVEAGELTAIDGGAESRPETVNDVKERVGDDPDLAAVALAAEQAADTPRSSLVSHLESVVASAKA